MKRKTNPGGGAHWEIAWIGVFRKIWRMCIQNGFTVGISVFWWKKSRVKSSRDTIPLSVVTVCRISVHQVLLRASPPPPLPPLPSAQYGTLPPCPDPSYRRKNANFLSSGAPGAFSYSGDPSLQEKLPSNLLQLVLNRQIVFLKRHFDLFLWIFIQIFFRVSQRFLPIDIVFGAMLPGNSSFYPSYSGWLTISYPEKKRSCYGTHRRVVSLVQEQNT